MVDPETGKGWAILGFDGRTYVRGDVVLWTLGIGIFFFTLLFSGLISFIREILL